MRQYSLVMIGAVAVGWIAHSVAVTHTVQAQSHPVVTEAMVDKMITDLSNWGRWGKDDQIGTVNLITPAKRKQALSLGKEGVSFSLARDEEFEPAADPSPFVLKMNMGRDGKVGGADSISVSYHGFAHTHMDALCHFQYKGKVYNGFTADEILTTKGALKNSVRISRAEL